MYGNWYLDPNGQTVNTNEDHRIESVDSRGWNRDRETDSDGHRIVKLMRASDTAVDGRFTCDIDGDRDNPRALRILYPSESLLYHMKYNCIECSMTFESVHSLTVRC